jgi:two-component system CheB/CheR fusion protein
MDLLAAGPLGEGLACIVVQHLAPSQPSALPELLAAHGPWVVRAATDGAQVEADHVYVITPGTRLAVKGDRLSVEPASLGDGGMPAIDHLFRSLAAHGGSHHAGVVLSGMGSDGADGLRALLQAGGVAAVQTPETAPFDSMPRNAIAAAGSEALVDEPGRLMRRVVDTLALRVAARATGGPEPGTLEAILARVTAVTGHDFSLYKPSTLLRRLERRMAIHGQTSADAYLRTLMESPQEAELLFREMLIGVTAWFRDPALWEALRLRVLPEACARAAARPDARLRGWVVGCSTGEEAYSLAIVLREVIDADPALAHLSVQLFATDLDADAVEVARRGLYPGSIADSVGPERLRRFFVAEGDRWRIDPELRGMVLFAHHDLIADAPFSRLDIVSCRNLLIYFRPPLQQRVLGLFRYVLRPGGVLALGSSETLGPAESLFEPVDPRQRVFRSGPLPLRDATGVFPIQTLAPATTDPKEKALTYASTGQPASMQVLVERLMLDEFSPPAVLVDATGNVLYLAGDTTPYLEPAAGRANWNLHAIVREELRGTVVQALQQAVAEHRAVDGRGVAAAEGGRMPRVDVAIRPVRGLRPGPLAELYLIVFRPAPPPPEQSGDARRRRRQPIDADLQAARDEVQALREEMRSSQEELQATNEELQSTNEELQSANEELTTSKEEMQAMNEELQTVNGELVRRLDDLALAQSDLQNLLNSTQIATLFLDGKGQVRRFTEQTKKLISLRDGDVGRPLSDLTTSLDYPSLVEDIREVLRTLEFREREIGTVDGRWFTVRIMPYRTQHNVIDGSVITFVDITAAKALETQARGRLPAG